MCPHCGNPTCFQDKHHIYHPKRWYKTPLEKEFRQAFTERLWRCQHDAKHFGKRPPMKPTRDVMEVMLQKHKMRIAQTG